MMILHVNHVEGRVEEEQFEGWKRTKGRGEEVWWLSSPTDTNPRDIHSVHIDVSLPFMIYIFFKLHTLKKLSKPQLLLHKLLERTNTANKTN